MTRRHRQRSAIHASDPSPPPPPRRGRVIASSGTDDDFSCSMLTDTSTFSSSDGKRAYSTTTTTTTTTRTAKRSVLPSASPSPSLSSTASNWSCGWDAPLTSEPTLSSLPTYVFDGTARDSHDGAVGSADNDDGDSKAASLDDQKKKKKDKKKSKKRDEKKGRGRDKSARKGRTAARRRPTDAETDAEAYRTNRASDPWARGLSMASAAAALASSKTDTETYQHDDPWTSHGTTAASFSEAETDRSGKWHPRRGTTTHGQSDSSHADTSTSASWQDHRATAHVTPSSLSSSDDHNSADSQTQSSALSIVATNSDGESTDDASPTSSSASSTSSSTLSSNEHTLDTTDDSAPRDYQDRATSDTTADTQQDSDANDHDDHHNHHDHRNDDDNTRGVSDDTASVQESSAGACQCACCTGSTADSQDTQHQDDDRDDEDGDSDASDDQQYEDGDHDGHADKAGLSDTSSSSSSIVPSSSSSSFSSTAADDWVNVKVGAKAPREPPVYIRACHRGTTHHRGPLCDDDSRDDDHHDDDDTDHHDHESPLHRAREDGVVETHSVTIAEPLVRPCEPDAPHAIFGRPCSAHSDHKGRSPRPSAPVVVAPGVCDLPGGIPESFCALDATYTLLAGAVDTRCRLESALVALRGRTRAQPALVFEGSDVNIVGVSGSGAITINERTYPLTATASFYIRAGSAFAVGNTASASPLVFVQQFVGAAAGLGFYHEVSAYEDAVGGAANVDPRVIEAIAARYHVRTASGPSSHHADARSAFVPPGTLRFLPTPQCEADPDDNASSSWSCATSANSTTTADDSTACCSACNVDDDDSSNSSSDESSSCDAVDAGVDSWGLRRRQLLVLAATDARVGPAVRPAATIRPTDLDAFIALGQTGARVTVRATVIRDPRSGGCPDVLARPTINGADAITLITGVAYWTYYDEAADNVIVQGVPGSRLPAVLPPPAFGGIGMSSGFGAAVPLSQQGLPPITIRPAPIV
ncbi:hypothetical protein pqer_cds_138 [Pandoravirus quercus]|uniref:Uncharacterized protein n=1 Tax=Pandoravirus quercus TaxID=2107709 RepID=A0A2U7U810_9VIRU|nr:hypothetical protein pqer_cds_138 [Pandoravirus quercus]AVK74560.1 hypothetical protein pqer_cds_138 [Pandoravirus quercus]